MTTILLSILCGGYLTEHQVAWFRYDATQAMVTYEEGGVLHAQGGLMLFDYDGNVLTLKSDDIFTSWFGG